jgi:ribosome recycling factor
MEKYNKQGGSMDREYMKDLEEGSKKALEYYEQELANVHTGRASTNLVSDVVIDAYGVKSPIKQIANITVTDPRSLAIQPWDKGNLVQIENALRESNLGFGVVNSGDAVRVNIPELTEERRSQFVKLAKDKAEEAKITIRNSRHAVWEATKKAKTEGSISEDDMYRREEEINKFVDSQNKKIEEIFAAKEKELREV